MLKDKKLDFPITVSNYFIGSNKKESDILIKYSGAGIFYETQNNNVKGYLFSFLYRKESTNQYARVLVKVKDFDDLEPINEIITKGNHRHHLLNKELKKTISINGYSVSVIEDNDIKYLIDKGLKVYQSNFNFFQSMMMDMNPIDLNLEWIIFPQEVSFSLFYINNINDLFKNKTLKSASTAYKFINSLIIWLNFFQRELDIILGKNNLIFSDICYFGINDQSNKDLILYTYFQKLLGYFNYFTDMGDKLLVGEKKIIYNSLEELSVEKLSSKILEGREQYKGLKELYLRKEKIVESGFITKEDFFSDKDIKYPKNLFKPSYGFSGLEDFLFKY